MIKVFIGSTSNDLKAYRQAALSICETQIADFAPIAMEQFGAYDTSSVELCLRKVREADVYVGIFAHRYGYIPQNETRSITEMEFDEASRIGISRLCFIIDPEYPWNPKFIECEQQPKLDTFKRRIDREMVRASFTDVESFKTEFIRSLRNWLPTFQAQRLPKVAKDDETFDIVLPEEPSLLVGRDNDLKLIKQDLGVVPSDKKRIVVIQGYPGVGKTTLVKKIAHDPEMRREFPDGILWINIGHDPKINDELNELADSLRLSLSSNKPHEMQKEIQRKLRGRRVLLIIDDVWNPEHGKYFDVTSNEGAILFTTRLNSVADNLNQYFKSGTIQHLRHLTDDEGFQLLSHVDVAPQFSAKYPQEARELVKELEGLPLAIKVAAGLFETRVRRNLPVDDLVRNINTQALGAKVEDRFDPLTGTTPTVNYVFKESTDALDKEARIKFAELCALQTKPATFSLKELQAVWQVDNAIMVVSRLIDYGLIEPADNQRFQIHSVVMMHACRLADEYGILDD